MESLDIAICKKVYEARAITLSMLFKVFPEVGEWTIRRAVHRLQRNRLLVMRRVSKSEKPGGRKKYVVMGKKGLERFGERGSSCRCLDARQAERILYSNAIAEQFIEAGLSEDHLIRRDVALQEMGLPSAMTVLDWVIAGSCGLYTVHARLPWNGSVLLQTIQKMAQADGVRGHIVVCPTRAMLAKVRRKYEIIAGRFGAEHFFMVSMDKPQDLRDIVDHIVNPQGWRNQVCQALYSWIPAEMEYSLPSTTRLGPLECRIRHQVAGVWLAGDLRAWDIALAHAARSWDQTTASDFHKADRIILLARDYRDARAKAMSLGWRACIWWALAKASSCGSLFCVRNGELVAADSITQGKTQARRKDLAT